MNVLDQEFQVKKIQNSQMVRTINIGISTLSQKL